MATDPAPLSVNAAINDAIMESISYWKVRHAVKEHIVKTSSSPQPQPVGESVTKFLETSGHALELQNLAFALNERLVLPYEGGPRAAPKAAWTQPAPCEAGALQAKASTASSPTAADKARMLFKSAAQVPVSPSELGIKSSSAVTPSGRTTVTANDATAPAADLGADEPEAIQQLRDEWQAAVVKNLMQIKDAAGMPLARRQRDADALTQMRVDAAELASQRIGDPESPCISPRVSLVKAHLISMDLLLRGVMAATAGASLHSEAPIKPSPQLINDVTCTPAPPRDGNGARASAADADPLGPFVPSIAQLQTQFADLHPRSRQVGADDVRHEWFREKALAQAKAILEKGSIPMSRKFLRRGAPASCRARLWDAALSLSSHLSYRDVQYFEGLCEKVEERELMTDLLIEKDLETLCDAEDYFLFEEHYRAVMLAFSRDASITEHAAVVPHPRLVGIGKGGHRHGAYPPNGVLPFEGLCTLVAPLAYLFNQRAAMFNCLRTMYCRYWCKLHCISAAGSSSPCMPVLAETFRQVLDHAEPALARHLDSIGCPPLSIALPWMSTAFVDVLNVREVLLLWDRVIGFDSLYVFPIAAAGLLAWRTKVLLSCTLVEEVEAHLDDLEEVQIVPILQTVLFLSSREDQEALLRKGRATARADAPR